MPRGGTIQFFSMLRSKKIIVIPVAILSILAGLIFFVKGCVQGYTNYGVVGTPGISDNGKLLTALIAENKATTYNENGGYRKTTYRTTYWLKQYELATGVLLKKQLLFTSSEIDPLTVECYGAINNNLWLHANGLMAYDLHTLGLVTTQQQLASLAGLPENIFENQHRLTDVQMHHKRALFTVTNGDKYQLSLTRLRLEKYNPATDTVKENSANKIQRQLHLNNVLGSRSDTVGKQVYILAKDSMQASATDLFTNAATNISYRMKLFTGAYIIKQYSGHHITNLQNIHPLNDSTYLNPFFLHNSTASSIIHLQQPTGYLLLHQDVTGSQAQAILTRIDTNNNNVWQSSTGISTKLNTCIVQNGYCIITGNKMYITSPYTGFDAMLMVYIKTGLISNISLEK
ncbi:MAG: hypothetical protein RL172_239 [Bacteroidota bacterium]